MYDGRNVVRRMRDHSGILVGRRGISVLPMRNWQRFGVFRARASLRRRRPRGLHNQDGTMLRLRLRLRRRDDRVPHVLPLIGRRRDVVGYDHVGPGLWRVFSDVWTVRRHGRALRVPVRIRTRKDRTHRHRHRRTRRVMHRREHVRQNRLEWWRGCLRASSRGHHRWDHRRLHCTVDPRHDGTVHIVRPRCILLPTRELHEARGWTVLRCWSRNRRARDYRHI
jgi:hypothetical protein